MQVKQSYSKIAYTGVVLEKRDLVALRRDAHGQWRPSIAFVQYGSDGIFDPISLSHCTRDCKARSVRRPIRIIDVLENFARRASGQRHTRQRGGQVRAQQDRHLSSGADGKNSAFGEIERPRLAAAGTHREYGSRLVAP